MDGHRPRKAGRTQDIFCGGVGRRAVCEAQSDAEGWAGAGAPRDHQFQKNQRLA
jgi:hypothetical protein